MKNSLLSLLLLAVSGVHAQSAKPAMTFEQLRAEASYANGFQVAMSMANLIKAAECDDESFYQGLKDTLHEKSRMKADEVKRTSKAYQDAIVAVRKGNPEALTETLKKDGSYATGVTLGNYHVLRGNFVDEIDEDSLVKGLKAGLVVGRRMARKLEMMHGKIRSFEAAKMDRRAAIGEKNLQTGREFLAENKKKDGIVTLESGLQYQVMKKAGEAHAKTPTMTDMVKVHYKGMLVDGTVFDDSHERGKPATFPLNGNIKGWIEALTKMKVGDKWKLFIPADLAYGTEAQPPMIGANEALVFEVELLDVLPMPGQP